MEQHYNQSYTKDQIVSVLEVIHDCVESNRYIISQNILRQENIDFVNEFNLKSNKQKEILMKITVEDFCHSLQNTNSGFEHEVLYVFCPQIILFNIDSEEELVDVYIKFNIIVYDEGKRLVTISFHKRNKPIDYLFR